MKMPKTPLGQWSVRFMVVFFLSFVLLQRLAASGQRGGATFGSNPVLAIPAFLAGVSGVLAFLTGMNSIIRNRERSAPVFLATAIGLCVVLFLLGELLVPH